MVGRGKSSGKAHVAVRCLCGPQLDAVPNFLIPPWREAPSQFRGGGKKEQLPLVRRVPSGESFTTNLL